MQLSDAANTPPLLVAGIDVRAAGTPTLAASRTARLRRARMGYITGEASTIRTTHGVACICRPGTRNRQAITTTLTQLVRATATCTHPFCHVFAAFAASSAVDRLVGTSVRPGTPNARSSCPHAIAIFTHGVLSCSATTGGWSARRRRPKSRTGRAARRAASAAAACAAAPTAAGPKARARAAPTATRTATAARAPPDTTSRATSATRAPRAGAASTGAEAARPPPTRSAPLAPRAAADNISRGAAPRPPTRSALRAPTPTAPAGSTGRDRAPAAATTTGASPAPTRPAPAASTGRGLARAPKRIRVLGMLYLRRWHVSDKELLFHGRHAVLDVLQQKLPEWVVSLGNLLRQHQRLQM